MMSDEFTSKIVKEFKENNGRITRGDTTFRLATDYGFCWGVERAVAMAFQARQHFPEQVCKDNCSTSIPVECRIKRFDLRIIVSKAFAVHPLAPPLFLLCC